jgi:hypothetical protein
MHDQFRLSSGFMHLLDRHLMHLDHVIKLGVQEASVHSLRLTDVVVDGFWPQTLLSELVNQMPLPSATTPRGHSGRSRG